MRRYDKWRRTHFGWMKEVCHASADPELCARMNAAYEAKVAPLYPHIVCILNNSYL